MTDMARVKKIYKLNGGGSGGGKERGKVNGAVSDGLNVNEAGLEVDETKELEILVLGSMALRGATN
jgi:EKC/KEOPS complex subunit CGI121/TPRKB